MLPTKDRAQKTTFKQQQQSFHGPKQQSFGAPSTRDKDQSDSPESLLTNLTLSGPRVFPPRLLAIKQCFPNITMTSQ